MEGITILSSTLQKVGGFTFTTVGVSLITLGIIGIILVYIIYEDYSLPMMIGTIIFGLILICGLIKCKEVKYSYHTYTITIENNVKMNEFMNRYQIVEREGKVYKVIPWNELPDGRPELEEYLITK